MTPSQRGSWLPCPVAWLHTLPGASFAVPLLFIPAVGIGLRGPMGRRRRPFDFASTGTKRAFPHLSGLQRVSAPVKVGPVAVSDLHITTYVFYCQQYTSNKTPITTRIRANTRLLFYLDHLKLFAELHFSHGGRSVERQPDGV